MFIQNLLRELSLSHGWEYGDASAVRQKGSAGVRQGVSALGSALNAGMRSQGGFTVLELAVGLVIVGILALVAIPSFSAWTANSRVRSVAETVQNGLRAAQAESLREGRQTAFVLTNNTKPGNQPASAGAATGTAVANGTNWYVLVLPLNSGDSLTAPVVQSGAFGSTVKGVTVTGPAQICFNSLGRVVSNTSTTTQTGSTCTAPSAMVTYDLARSGAQNSLEVQVQPGGQIRLCDKTRTLSATTPDGC